MNWIALAEVAGAFLIVQADFLNRLLGTTPLSNQQWGLALLAPAALLVVWELGKWLARRLAGKQQAPGEPAPATSAA